MRRGRARALGLLMFIGLAMWIVGAVNLVPETPLLSIALLIGGGIQASAAAFLLLASRPSGQLDHRFMEACWFCGTLGAGVASIGLAISPLTRWWMPALAFAAGGVALIAWSPQAFGRASTGQG